MKSRIVALFAAFVLLAATFVAIPMAAANREVSLPLTPALVQPSVYKIEVGNGLLGHSGTGWKIAQNVMMTAGHVCDTSEIDFPGLTTKFKAISRDNAEYTLEVIRFVNNDEVDLCILKAEGVPGAALLLAGLPTYGEQVWYVGAPAGIYGDGVAPFGWGHYIGGDMVMINGYGGASGSPLFTRTGVFGVLVAGHRGTDLVYFMSTRTILEFLAPPVVD